jgi:hypothetical protein
MPQAANVYVGVKLSSQRLIKIGLLFAFPIFLQMCAHFSNFKEALNLTDLT